MENKYKLLKSFFVNENALIIWLDNNLKKIGIKGFYEQVHNVTTVSQFPSWKTIEKDGEPEDYSNHLLMCEGYDYNYVLFQYECEKPKDDDVIAYIPVSELINSFKNI